MIKGLHQVQFQLIGYIGVVTTYITDMAAIIKYFVLKTYTSLQSVLVGICCVLRDAELLCLGGMLSLLSFSASVVRVLTGSDVSLAGELSSGTK